MKKIIITLIAVLAFTAVASAQPKSIGGRLGYKGIEVSYEHNMGGANFLELNGGLDFGWHNEHPGFIASGIYNFMIAQPNWSRGEWGFYAGPGAYAGYFDAKVANSDYWASGFSLGVTGQVGLEYTFWFPLQLSVDVRPYLGLHFSGDRTGWFVRDASLFSPTLSVRYRF